MIAVFIGRFNPFHNGHASVLERALLRYERVLVLIGSCNKSKSVKNPFSFEDRLALIRSWYCEYVVPVHGEDIGQLVIEPLNDYDYNDSKWISEVMSTVSQHVMDDNKTKPVLVGANRDDTTWYLNSFGNFFELDLMGESPSFKLSATELREVLFSDESRHLSYIKDKVPSSTYKFLEQYIHTKEYQRLIKEYSFIKEYKNSWSNVPYPPTFLTVDAVVVQSGHLLVVTRKGPLGHGLWALPGGYIEEKEIAVNSVIRELKEETDIEMSPAQLKGSIVVSKVFDKPDRSMRGRTVTIAYLIKLQDDKKLPKIKAQPEEVLKVSWVPLSQVLSNPTNWFEDHYSIVVSMLGHI